MEYYVLKQGRTQGPFTESEITSQLASGMFSPEDLGQCDGARHWTPLRRLFETNGSERSEKDSVPPPSEAAEMSPPAIPQGFSIEAKEWWRNTSAGVEQLLQRYPLDTGLVFLALGCVLLLLSYVPIFIIGPALVGALFGGGFAMLRGRVMAGLLLCAAAVFVPALIWSAFFWGTRILGLSH